jgi:iron complex transport system ATP-binding protein
MSPLIEVRSISALAGNRSILNDMTVAFDAGQSVALIGPNGAGKSTLLRVLSGELKPTRGQVRLRDQDLADYDPQALADHRAVLSQRITTAFPFSVADVVRMGAGDHRGASVAALIEAVLAELDLDKLADRPVTALSGGEQQRVHFARVMLQHACGLERFGSGILLLDEPTANLDLTHQLGMLESVKGRTRNGALAIAVLHDLNLAAMFADWIVVVDHGRIDCAGRPPDVITDEMLDRVFGIETNVSEVPTPGTPFVLPQVMSPKARALAQTK